MAAIYDFQNISFDDFERLCADLMQEQLDVPLESFRTGRDGGIDLRYAPSKHGAIVIQCKRYASDAFTRLYREFETKELAKIKVLKPARYVVCTSCLLSPLQKDRLYELLKPFCQSSGDIYGADELNRLIAENDVIERRDFKLWLGSTAVLQRVLNAGIFAYSEHEVETLQREISRYVIHDGFDRALRMLDETHHCVIVGMPGVGKTTAARLLLAHYLREDYEVVSVTRDVEEAWKVLDRSENAKQVIYYDDFLGQVTFSQKLEKNEDRRLLDLIAHCRNSKGKRFILTTRDYIFDQALTAHEPLDRAKETLKRSTVTLNDYTAIVRARLLANHLQFSKIRFDVLHAVVQRKTYELIIEHPNFLPRVIEQICSNSEVEGRTPEQFVQNAIEVLNDPSRVWERPFSQISSDARYLAYALASLNGDCESSRLEKAWLALRQQAGHRTDRTYVEILRETEGSFTHTQKYPGFGSPAKLEGRMVRFVNPSVREFVMADLLKRRELLEAAFRSAVSFNQLMFWKESRHVDAGKDSHAVAAEQADLLASKAAELLAVGEPTLEIWAARQTIFWNTGAKKISRLHYLFEAFSHMERNDLSEKICLTLFGQDLHRFTTMMSSDDLFWTAQVLRLALDAQKAIGPDRINNACEQLEILTWSDRARDFADVRHLWEAAGWAIEVASDSAKWHDRVREQLVVRTRELCEDLPHDWTAEDLEQASEELELVMMDFDDELDDELKTLKTLAREAREAEDENDSSRSSMSSRYRGSDLNRGTDIDGVFSTLVSHLQPPELG